MIDNDHDHPTGGDPLIDEVRAIRRAICDQFGNDVDRLCDHLQEVEREYRTRTGRFAGVPRKLDHELFPETAASDPAPPINEGKSSSGQRTSDHKLG